MKRTFLDSPVSGHDPKMKKVKQTEEEEQQVNDTGFMDLDENLLFEVLKHADAKTLATAACVNKQWYKTSQDERLWELICTRHLANVGCGNQQLRSVVLALGGFRRLHSLYLCQLSRPTKSTVSPSTSTSTSTSASTSAPTSTSASSSNWAPFPRKIGSKQPARWGKDEVHLSLSLLSIRFYEKMNSSNRGS
ncbi:F-box protein GID2 [Pistacia vera]|uniref:F-box protein GID2 n=1 Tax=Pistacia vera TaxID=55513 RepID=UPI001262ED0A|nr:F-box protein GID2 [Pistacia vera]